MRQSSSSVIFTGILSVFIHRSWFVKNPFLLAYWLFHFFNFIVGRLFEKSFFSLFHLLTHIDMGLFYVSLLRCSPLHQLRCALSDIFGRSLHAWTILPVTCMFVFLVFFFNRFNYRATHHMVENGFYNFLNWFDDRAWYPLGRIVGGTVCVKIHCL